MTIHVVDCKKLDMTDDEWGMYQKIVQSYTSLGNKGEDMFIGLFETNDAGIITFLKPPSKRHTSLEVFLFLMALQSHQHLRLMHNEVSDVCNQMKEKMCELNKTMQEISSKKTNK